MWFEIIPAYGIIAGALAIPGALMFYVHKGVLGTSYKRHMGYRFNRLMYQRDGRLTGNPYTLNGLEILGDEETEESKN